MANLYCAAGPEVEPEGNESSKTWNPESTPECLIQGFEDVEIGGLRIGIAAHAVQEEQPLTPADDHPGALAPTLMILTALS